LRQVDLPTCAWRSRNVLDGIALVLPSCRESWIGKYEETQFAFLAWERNEDAFSVRVPKAISTALTSWNKFWLSEEVDLSHQDLPLCWNNMERKYVAVRFASRDTALPQCNDLFFRSGRQEFVAEHAECFSDRRKRTDIDNCLATVAVQFNYGAPLNVSRSSILWQNDYLLLPSAPRAKKRLGNLDLDPLRHRMNLC